MTVETKMFAMFAVGEILRWMVMTEHGQAMCSRRLPLQHDTSDGQWKSDDMTERTARL